MRKLFEFLEKSLVDLWPLVVGVVGLPLGFILADFGDGGFAQTTACFYVPQLLLGVVLYRLLERRNKRSPWPRDKDDLTSLTLVGTSLAASVPTIFFFAIISFPGIFSLLVMGILTWLVQVLYMLMDKSQDEKADPHRSYYRF